MFLITNLVKVVVFVVVVVLLLLAHLMTERVEVYTLAQKDDETKT